MSVDVQPSDIALVVNNESDSQKIASAIQRLRHSKIDDVRAISAQATVRNYLIKAAWIADWIAVEDNAEVRGYLYLALSLKNKKLAKRVLKYVRYDKLSTREEIYYFGALSICYRSRKYMLNIMLHIFSRSYIISSEASRMCRMLIEDDDQATLEFLEILERDRKISQ